MSKPQSDRKPFRRTSKRPAGDASAVDDIIYGLHACEAALANPHRSIRRAFATENAARKLATAFAERGLVPEPASPRQLDARLGPDTVHQGILLEVEPLETTELITIIENAAETGAPILVLDQVTDPHNVGAVLRSAAVFGAAGLVMTRRHSPPLGATVAKAASGALELVHIALVQNLAQALATLREQRATVLGLDGNADCLIEDALDPGEAVTPVAFVLGAEGRGLRERTRELCSGLVRIGTAGPITSLNVSNAAAVALHLATMRRRERPGLDEAPAERDRENWNAGKPGD